ncbi:Uncharacterised protein [Shewanella baltica]|nr:Uncharacterised protein [Shewanella baltica]
MAKSSLSRRIKQAWLTVMSQLKNVKTEVANVLHLN